MNFYKIKEVVGVASGLLAIPVPAVRTANPKEEAALFGTATQRAVADCNGYTIILRKNIGDTPNDLVQAIFAALHELRHLWQFKRIFSPAQFADKEKWRLEFEEGSTPDGDVKAYNSRAIEIDAHAFAAVAMELLCGIKMRIGDLPNGEAIQARYELLKSTLTDI